MGVVLKKSPWYIEQWANLKAHHKDTWDESNKEFDATGLFHPYPIRKIDFKRIMKIPFKKVPLMVNYKDDNIAYQTYIRCVYRVRLRLGV